MDHLHFELMSLSSLFSIELTKSWKFTAGRIDITRIRIQLRKLVHSNPM